MRCPRPWQPSRPPLRSGSTGHLLQLRVLALRCWAGVARGLRQDRPGRLAAHALLLGDLVLDGLERHQDLRPPPPRPPLTFLIGESSEADVPTVRPVPLVVHTPP